MKAAEDKRRRTMATSIIEPSVGGLLGRRGSGSGGREVVPRGRETVPRNMAAFGPTGSFIGAANRAKMAASVILPGNDIGLPKG